MKRGKDSLYCKYIKRLLDFLCAFFAIIVLSPLFVILTVLGAIKMKGNPFFAQERPGLHEKIFKLFKFRTMTNEKDQDGRLLPDEKRLTSYGKFLRSTSLDELPELLNILIGNMSVVGPRPLLVQYIPLYNETQHHRHDVRPGLTGLAQVNGRFNILWKDKFAYDIEYVNNISFKNDVVIVIKTAIEVFRREDIENDELGSWYPFLGNDVEDQQIELRKKKDKV